MNQPKDRFHLPEGIYLLNHSVGCLPHQALTAQVTFFESWQTQGSDAWEMWLAEIDGFRTEVATLLNGEMREVCPQVNISGGIAKLLAALPPRKGKDTIVLSELDFPSVGFALQQAQKLGYKLDFVPAKAGRFSVATWERHLTANTQLVLITHSLYGNSFLNPVAEIINIAQQHDIISVVDVAQSAGVVPIDVREWGADVVVGSSVKWLCGGPGAGFMWLNPALLNNLQPLDVGWFSHQNPFAFDIHHFRYASDARRFWGGTPSILPYMIARRAIEQIKALGVAQIRHHNQTLTQTLITFCQKRGLTYLTPTNPAQRGGTVCIQFADSPGMYEYLKQNQILVDFRPGFGVRFSPHIYNDAADIEAVMTCLAKKLH